jgi:hypothetical protein
MSSKPSKQERFLEITFVLICLGLCCLLYQVAGYKMVVLNLFYLPVLLAAFFLGRYRAGVLALLCVVAAATVTALDLNNFAAYTSPLAIGLALTIWSAVLGLNAVLAGTLSDERSRKIAELHDAYVGVVEVLSQYLNSADPRLNDRASKISQLSEQVADQMRLSDKERDDIRVAALLYDVGSIEITARVIRKAIGDLRSPSRIDAMEHTFQGSDLVQSLGSVMTGALPLLLGHGSCPDMEPTAEGASSSVEPPIGVRIIRTVRRYVMLLKQEATMGSPLGAIAALEDDIDGEHHPAVLHALKGVVFGASGTDGCKEERSGLAVKG